LSLSVVPRWAKTKSLFVSRFSPEVTTTDIERSLNEQLKLKSLSCTRLKLNLTPMLHSIYQ
jgi:hypothetical protein